MKKDLTRKQVDVLHVCVEALQSETLLTRHVAVQLFESVDSFIEAQLHVVDVARQSVITTSLNVERNQITSECVGSSSIQMVAHIVGDERIHASRVARHHASND